MSFGSGRYLDGPCAESHPFSRLKKTYGNLDMVTCWLSSASRTVQSSPADNACKSVRQYIKKILENSRLGLTDSL